MPAKHRFFVPPERVDGDRVSFTGEQAHQIGSVLRLRPGDQVLVFDGDGRRELLVRLERVAKTTASGCVVASYERTSEPSTRLVAYPALLQRDKFEQVLQKLVEIGVSEIVPVLTARALVRRDPDAARLERWAAIVREAAEQSGRCVVPAVRNAMTLDDALRRAVAAGPTLFAFEGRSGLRPLSQALASLAAPPNRCVSLFVGPEGGYTPEEVVAAERRGAMVVTLGPRILRTETASPALAAVVMYALGEMG